MKLLNLDQVTLVSVTSVDLPATELALRISMHDIEFGAVKLLTSEEFFPQDPKIEVIKIPKIDINGYSKFILCTLHKYIDTEFCLVVQADGFVINANRWIDNFFNFDYIGAPWPEVLYFFGTNEKVIMKNRVGNGGFSLRSKKLLLTTKSIDFENLKYPTRSEDMIICHYLYDEMVKMGIKFPAPDLAAQFSIETESAFFGQNLATSFGFHGKALRDIIFDPIKR
jgi:hypothetical protein